MEPWQEARSADRREGKLSRGWRLTLVAWELIRQDRSMLALALAGIFFGTTFSLLFVYLGGFFSSAHHSGLRLTLLAFAALYLATLASVFFNVALACVASAAFDGERMSAAEALGMAWGKRRRIAQWALISALVGTLIAELANRLPGGARLVARLAGAAWGLATIFVVPILAMEGVGAGEALKRSVSVVKRRWGEGVAGEISIGAWATVATIPIVFAIVIGVVLLRHHPEAGASLIGVGVVGLVAVLATVAATQQIFAVALYRYAIDAPIGGFASSDLEYPFVPAAAGRKRKSWILRIGGAFLGLFLVLAIVAAIVGPHRHTGAQGYFHVDYSPTEAAGLSAGSPVVLNGNRVGSVTRLEIDGSGVQVEFHTDPRLRRIVETTPAYVDRLRGLTYIRIGGQPPIRPGPGSKNQL